MAWFVLMHLVGFVVDLVSGARGQAEEKDRRIASLQHQVRLLQRRSPRPPRLSRWEKLTFAVLATRLNRPITGPRGRLARAILLVQSATVLKWTANSRAGNGPSAVGKGVGDRRSTPR